MEIEIPKPALGFLKTHKKKQIFRDCYPYNSHYGSIPERKNTSTKVVDLRALKHRRLSHFHNPQFGRAPLVGGWALPLWKIWVRQLGLLCPTEWRVIQFMFQTTNRSFFSPINLILTKPPLYQQNPHILTIIITYDNHMGMGQNPGT